MEFLRKPNSMEVLGELLRDLADDLSKPKQKLSITYRTKTGCIYDCTNGPKLSKPSYNLYIEVEDTVIVSIQYQLDKRFSLDVNKSEIHRIENLLAIKAISTIMMYGIETLIGQRYNYQTVMVYTIKESEDKQFLSLN